MRYSKGKKKEMMERVDGLREEIEDYPFEINIITEYKNKKPYYFVDLHEYKKDFANYPKAIHDISQKIQYVKGRQFGLNHWEALYFSYGDEI